MSEPSILVVDDDASIRDALSDYLGRFGFQVRTARNGVEMDRALAAARPDVVLLDVMMPGEDGLSICRRLARTGPPMLMLSAVGDTMDRVVGLELGAADYLAKPFDPRELLARIRALLRRHEPEQSAGTILRFAGWSFDADERKLTDPGGVPMPLTSGEAALLRAFAERAQRLLSRDQLLDLAWGPVSDSFDRAVDLQVSRLRRKLAERDPEPLIETVRGEGYRFLPAVRKS